MDTEKTRFNVVRTSKIGTFQFYISSMFIPRVSKTPEEIVDMLSAIKSSEDFIPGAMFYSHTEDELKIETIGFDVWFPRKKSEFFHSSVKHVSVSCSSVDKSFYDDLCAFIENIPESVTCFDINIVSNSSYDDLYDFFERVNFPATLTDLSIDIKNYNKDELFSIYKIGDLSTIEKVVLRVNDVRYI